MKIFPQNNNYTYGIELSFHVYLYTQSYIMRLGVCGSVRECVPSMFKTLCLTFSAYIITAP